MSGEATRPGQPLTMGRVRRRIDETKETLFAAALHDLEMGAQPSIRAAADYYSLKYETLRDRKRGARNCVESHEDQQHLTIVEEMAIEEWIIKVDYLGWPPRIDYIHQMALGFIESHGIQNPTMGNNWITRFLYRHPNLASRFTNQLHKQWAYASNPEIICDFFRKVGSPLQLKEKGANSQKT